MKLQKSKYSCLPLICRYKNNDKFEFSSGNSNIFTQKLILKFLSTYLCKIYPFNCNGLNFNGKISAIEKRR